METMHLTPCHVIEVRSCFCEAMSAGPCKVALILYRTRSHAGAEWAPVLRPFSGGVPSSIACVWSWLLWDSIA